MRSKPAAMLACCRNDCPEMIVVDISAIATVAFDEPEREIFVQAIQQADRALVSVVSSIKTRIGVRDHGGKGCGWREADLCTRARRHIMAAIEGHQGPSISRRRNASDLLGPSRTDRNEPEPKVARLPH
jgi:uncharacterized protein with PIN domain